jgi:uracil phosphoribosyltransferase
MIATGGSVRVAIDELKKVGVNEENITFINLISYFGAIRPLLDSYPKIKMITACIDPELTESKYIAPGLGDFGCR